MALCASCTDYQYSKNSISAVDIIADLIIGTSLVKYVLTVSSTKIHVYYNLLICTAYSCSVAWTVCTKLCITHGRN